MKGVQRRKAILEAVRREGGISVSDIAARFAISKMTAHRDLELLEGLGEVKRIFGGAIPVGGEPAEAVTESVGPAPGAGKTDCMICSRPATQHLLYTLTLAGGEQRFACCPHCGISAHLVLKDKVQMAMAADYLNARLHPAQRSHFLMESAAAPCCHPSILAFENQEMARRFQAGFGGRLGGLQEAIDFLEQDLALNKGESSCPHCAAARGK
ncbi:hypothetical protein DESUT3_12840 [Desulfuromonas versatilis]|uniref:HTH deoR-type domain-containing protein n=1 Tax=Desulfuromonas versatilis TaxID=2802975 RepID=A0ABN6DVX9_9BACT|nr:DeoR family transcriptional regulator [Desulfuromonas versatilis]BCR04215.1 hypothetical protein DESUT3_12840 [Desulfuromonas versatilis]